MRVDQAAQDPPDHWSVSNNFHLFRVLRLTILQQGEAISKNNTLDLAVIKELRTIRDKVNRVLDMVAVETSKANIVDVKAELEVEETVTEAVSQLQLEQSKEFDPLEQSQIQVSHHFTPVREQSGPLSLVEIVEIVLSLVERCYTIHFMP